MLDSVPALRDAVIMTENPYAIPVDDLVARARVPVTEQIEVQAESRQPAADRSAGVLLPHGDGMSGDADGD